jgi:hypothetical protein
VGPLSERGWRLGPAPDCSIVPQAIPTNKHFRSIPTVGIILGADRREGAGVPEREDQQGPHQAGSAPAQHPQANPGWLVRKFGDVLTRP